jgi:hypothetical protein
MLVVGFALLIVFGLHERFTARTPFLPYDLLTSRSVMGACLLSFTYQISYYAWNSYFTSFLQVVTNLTLAEAGYVASTFDVLSGVLLLSIGLIISRVFPLAVVHRCANLHLGSGTDGLFPSSWD